MVEVFNFTKSRIDKKYFQKTAEVILRRLKQPKDIEISLVFINDARMRKLNKKYCGKDKTTDVLSFNYQDKISPILPLQKEGIIGEIIISVPQAKRQARERNYPLKAELTELFVHGILHLAGHEDETGKGYEKMTKRQRELIGFLAKN